MTVFVDDMEVPYHPPHRPGITYVMSHMIADSEKELHAMAQKIGVYRKWFQANSSYPHYDITKGMKAKAILYGARPITWRQLGLMTGNANAGFGLGTPEDAEKIFKKRIADIRRNRK